MNAQIKLADIDAVYKRLKLSSKFISYIDLLNSLFYVNERKVDPDTIRLELVKQIERRRHQRLETQRNSIDIQVPVTTFNE